MTLKGYYEALPQRIAPRKDFIQKVVAECGDVDPQSVRNWCKYGMRPRKYSHVKALVKITGIEEADLWKE